MCASKLRSLPIPNLNFFRKRRAWIAGVVLLLILMSWLKAVEVMNEPVHVRQSERLKADSSADCGIVLTGGPGRIREGFELLQQGLITRLIVSGVHSGAQLEEIFPYLPYYPEVKTDQITLDKRSLTTFGNARFSLNIAESFRCRDILLITSQYHMPRAYSIFRSVFPMSTQIKKFTIANAKSESGLFDLGLEVLKFYSYYIFRLVEI